VDSSENVIKLSGNSHSTSENNLNVINAINNSFYQNPILEDDIVSFSSSSSSKISSTHSQCEDNFIHINNKAKKGNVEEIIETKNEKCKKELVSDLHNHSSLEIISSSSNIGLKNPVKKIKKKEKFFPLFSFPQVMKFLLRMTQNVNESKIIISDNTPKLAFDLKVANCEDSLTCDFDDIETSNSLNHMIAFTPLPDSVEFIFLFLFYENFIFLHILC
jgi:hypothetical protein